MSRYTKEVLVVLDADEAGEKATDRTMRILSSVGLSARIIRLPDCKDPDEYIQKHGAGKFEALLQGAISDIEYRLYVAAKGVDLEADDGRLQYLNKACEVLAEIEDPIAVDLYVTRLSTKYGVAKQAISSNLKEIVEKRRRSKNKKELSAIVAPNYQGSVNPQKQQYRRAAGAEEAVISILIKHPDMFESTYSSLKPSDMITNFNRRLYSKVCDILEVGNTFDLILLGDEFSPDEVGFVSQLIAKGTVSAEVEKELSDAIGVIFEEKEKLVRISTDDMTDEEWAAEMFKRSKSKLNKNI